MLTRGFTLVETIFSTLFISLTVLAIVNLFPGAYLSVKKSEVQLQADLLANSLMDEMRNRPWSQLVDGPFTSAEPIFGDVNYDGITYYSKVVVREEAATLKHVKVEIWLRVSGDENDFNKLQLPNKPVLIYETSLHKLHR